MNAYTKQNGLTLLGRVGASPLDARMLKLFGWPQTHAQRHGEFMMRATHARVCKPKKKPRRKV